jgi:hypothetical protein
MTKHQILEAYGQSVYQIRLQVAISLYAKLDRQPEEALKSADNFVQTLLNEDHQWLKSQYE